MDEIVQDFLTETIENLAQLDADIVALEQDRTNGDLLSNIFRTIHTIKGTCGFIGLPRLESVAHAGENVLGKFRDGELEVTPDAITVILDCVDRIKEIVAVLNDTGQEPEGDDSALIKVLDAYYKGEVPQTSESENTEEENDSAAERSEVAEEEETKESSKEEGSEAHSETKGADEAERAKDAGSAAATAKAQPPEKPKAPAVKKETNMASQTIRVSVGLLENLITSVSELVLARNQLLQISRSAENEDFKVPLQRLNHVTSELQEGLMRTRMQPIGNAWAQLPRIIRDLSRDLGKDIDLVMEGADTELDRQVIEIIKDPLMHMVRNSADHGLEMPQERLAAGKSRKGQVKLKAYHAGGHVAIEISDDGKGLHRDKIVDKIIANNLASADDIGNMSDNRIYNYIFAAGFSTAEKVTNVSGRGVGMDVVRTNIEKIGGTVEVRSSLGQGSTFIVKIPLTLAIVSALIVRCCTQKFAIPQVSIIELVQASEDSEHTIEYVKGHPVLRLRNRLLPLVTLSEMLELQSLSPEKPVQKRLRGAQGKDASATDDQEDRDWDDVTAEDIASRESQAEASKSQRENLDDSFIVVVQVGSTQFGMIVDEVYDTEEIVVKPVSPLLRRANIFAGNTILGDGSVVMILDPKGIATRVGDMHSDEVGGREERNNRGDASNRFMRFLIFSSGDGAPKAVPLSLVVRLEEISGKDLETSNGMQVIQYRNKLMPIMSIDGFVDLQEDDVRPVLVFSQNDEYVGILVQEILDIVEENLDIKMHNGQAGSFGSIVINERTTELVDVDHFIHQIYPDWSSMLEKNESSAQQKQKALGTLCYIDSCRLYRNLFSPLIEMRNLKVHEYASVELAFSEQEDNPFDYTAVIIAKDAYGKKSKEEFFDNFESVFGNIPCFLLGNSFSAEEEDFYLGRGCIACLGKGDREANMVTITDYIMQLGSLVA